MGRLQKELTVSILNKYLASLVTASADALDANDQKKARLLTATVGVLATIFMWSVSRSYPWILGDPHGIVSTLVIVLILAAPFATVVSVAYLAFPDIRPGEEAYGPMSGYLRKQRDDKRWKIMVIAGMISAANLFCMMIASNIP